ncbi:MAG: acetyl-CoA carboxylase biotin carboxyl carrier protein [Candidatus Omnitrophota bacterium]
MNIKEIKEMIDLMNKNNLNELEIEKDGMKVKLKKTGGVLAQQVFDERLVTPQVLTQALSKEEAKTAEVKKKNTIEIKAPMVGTFYTSPSPETPSFVEIGTTIEKGQVICIIEAMKLMNEIKSDVKGKVVDILIENADPIEFGQTLFIIELS